MFDPASLKEETLYARLGVDKKESDTGIKKAYFKIARKYHPDKNNDPRADEVMKYMNVAYEVLSNPQERNIYDLQQALKEREGVAARDAASDYDQADYYYQQNYSQPDFQQYHQDSQSDGSGKSRTRKSEKKSSSPSRPKKTSKSKSKSSRSNEGGGGGGGEGEEKDWWQHGKYNYYDYFDYYPSHYIPPYVEGVKYAEIDPGDLRNVVWSSVPYSSGGYGNNSSTRSSSSNTASGYDDGGLLPQPQPQRQLTW